MNEKPDRVYHRFVVRKYGTAMVEVRIWGDISDEEADEYVRKAEKEHPGTYMLEVKIDGDDVDLTYHLMPMERIRRITGYLVGTMDRWNDAKREEEHDRVKHGISG